MKKALLTGITGQDGAYLTEFLLDRDYEVHGIVRRHSTPCTDRIDHILNNPELKDRVILHYGDLTDASSLSNIVGRVRPDEVYNLAAQSHVGVSFEVPEYTALATGVGGIRLLPDGVVFHISWKLIVDGIACHPERDQGHSRIIKIKTDIAFGGI